MFYVKLILNELKRPEPISEICETTEKLPECAAASGIANINYENTEIEIETATKADEAKSDNLSLTSKTEKKKSVKELVSNALFLDVLRDYVNIVKRERPYHQNWIVILFLVMAIVANSLPFHNGILNQFR